MVLLWVLVLLLVVVREGKGSNDGCLCLLEEWVSFRGSLEEDEVIRVSRTEEDKMDSKDEGRPCVVVEVLDKA